MKIERRGCPVCSSENFELAYQQKFTNLVGMQYSFQQQIGVCKKCGMVYVRDYLQDSDLQKYYSLMSNYEYAENNNDWPIEDQRKSHRQYVYIKNFLLGKSYFNNVLDVGCSLGYTLSLFNEDGSQTLGIEPSEKLRKLAMGKYGVEVATDYFSKEFDLTDQYDLIILSHILEHLKNPKEFLSHMLCNLQNDGLIFIEVPSIELFDDKEMFGFTFEHINYFSHGSLVNIMHEAGFEEVDQIIFDNDASVAPFYPTLGGIWRKSSKKSHSLINRYDYDKSVLTKYVRIVTQYMDKINNRIEEIARKNVNVAIWGAGTLTANLLANTQLGNLSINIIYDSDPKKNGGTMNAIPIKKPECISDDLLLDDIDLIVIGSWSSQLEIKTMLVDSGVDHKSIIQLF